MKKSFVFIFLFLANASIYAQNVEEKNNKVIGPSISWLDETSYDFSNVKKGSSVVATFEFLNNGSEVVIISDAKGSCGCTSVKFPQQPILPGEKGTIKAIFNAQSIGNFYKTVTVTTNTKESTKVLNIKGIVVE